QLGGELGKEFFYGDGQQIQATIEGAVTAVLGAAGIGDLPGDQPVWKLLGELGGQRRQGVRDRCGGVDAVAGGGADRVHECPSSGGRRPRRRAFDAVVPRPGRSGRPWGMWMDLWLWTAGNGCDPAGPLEGGRRVGARSAGGPGAWFAVP